MKQQKQQDTQQTSFDKTENVHPFTKYMVYKGVKQHYIPHIFTVVAGSQFSIAESVPIDDTNATRVRLYSKLCRFMSQVTINVHEILQTFANIKQSEYSNFNMSTTISDDSLFVIPPIRKHPDRAPNSIELLKSLKLPPKYPAPNKTIINQPNSTIEFQNQQYYVTLANIDPNSPAVIVAPFDAPEVLYIQRVSLYWHQITHYH